MPPSATSTAPAPRLAGTTPVSPREGGGGSRSVLHANRPEAGYALDVLVAPPARQRHPLPEGYPPVVEMLLGETDLCSISLSRVGDGSQTSTARRLADPGGDDALGRDQHAGLFVELADGPFFEALARLKTSGWRLPGACGALEQEHAAVFPDGQESRDEIRLQSVPVAKISRLLTIQQVYGPRGRFANRPAPGLRSLSGAVATRGRPGVWRSEGSGRSGAASGLSAGSSRAS